MGYRDYVPTCSINLHHPFVFFVFFPFFKLAFLKGISVFAHVSTVMAQYPKSAYNDSKLVLRHIRSFQKLLEETETCIKNWININIVELM